MNKTIVVFGSSTGTCEAIAEKIASKLGAEVINVQDLTADVVADNQNLILGTSTWGAGELQDDWYDGLRVLSMKMIRPTIVSTRGLHKFRQSYDYAVRDESADEPHLRIPERCSPDGSVHLPEEI